VLEITNQIKHSIAPNSTQYPSAIALNSLLTELAVCIASRFELCGASDSHVVRSFVLPNSETSAACQATSDTERSFRS